MENLWNNDFVQFTRLLAEINAAGFESLLPDLCASTDLTTEQIYEIFERAEKRYEEFKDLIWLNTLKPGDKVFWNDPDDISSGIYTIVEIMIDEEYDTDDETIIYIKNEHGTEAEVPACELTTP